MAPELDALRVAADQLIRSDPLQIESWDIDLSGCIPIARAHLHSWSLDSQIREDRRSRGKRGLSVVNSNKGGGGVFIMDSKLETMVIRGVRAETQGINKSNNAIANACAELFLSRTSAPFYHGEPSCYPFLAPNEKEITSRTKDVWVYLRESSGSLKQSSSQDFKDLKQYYSVAVRVDLLVESGLVDRTNAPVVVKKVYPHGLYVPLFQRGNPSIQPGLGSELHTLGDPGDKLHLAAIACRGAFSGLFTWDRFNNTLVQGGWPWLRQYSRAYAKMIYTAMVLLFAAIENYDLGDMDGTRWRILALAGKLVGNPSGGPSPWRVRKGVYLKCPKITVSGRSEGQQISGQAAVNGEFVGEKQTVNDSILDPGSVPWTYLTVPAASIPQQLPSHVVMGLACSHRDLDTFTSRVKLAHSVSELEAATNDGDSITVALTRNDSRARLEVLAWALRGAIMTVQRKDGQCIGCAIKLAHCIGGLVVIA